MKYKLKECCKFIDYRGKTPKKSEFGYRLITAKNIKPYGYSDEPREYIPKESYESIMVRGYPKPGDILFTTEAPLGNVCRIPIFNEPFAVGQRLIVIQPNTELLDCQYLVYKLRSSLVQEEIFRHSSGSTVRGIRSKELIEIEIKFPELEKQKIISKELLSLEKIIRFRYQELNTLDELVKARFIEMFGNNKYEETSLSELTELITKGTTPTTAGYSFLDKGINFFKIESINDNHSINLDKVAYIGEDCYKAFKRSQLKEGDILFSIAGAIGRSAIIQEKDLPGNTNQALAIIRLRKNCNITQKFLISILESPMVIEQYNKKKRGVAQMNLSLQDIGKLHLIVPPIDEQNEFEFFVKQVDKSRYVSGFNKYIKHNKA